ncbi:hypothetical protein CABS01_17231 [Colletotrichum abscissum]|uniref:Uncharacterized protein n=1 Tax=Colletotrichum tamarilloi TaxID=1209934 RepID=A0ABQ9QFY5_9PEZI|nr:uncharacterized protein CTAM01_17380 [Colletotrichum tamarilloi]XP_060394334.1 uncharacterized protein CABS01_17231 [Colletotrichum abscissum]KAK1446486.1 hypothetical protein CTAM01_17380 [Colletotrichum tamarilloi]KAK1483481.1 hypothetical protein CABS01_17231 [Colletotrichum abscissum]
MVVKAATPMAESKDGRSVVVTPSLVYTGKSTDRVVWGGDLKRFLKRAVRCTVYILHGAHDMSCGIDIGHGVVADAITGSSGCLCPNRPLHDAAGVGSAK